MGLGGLVVPGTVRDSLYILDAIHSLDVPERPEQVITDTASYSDIVFGLFAICGYQFSPRIADIGDTRLQLLHDESYRRAINTQLNLTEARHCLARRIFFGNLGELRQKYITGMEDQLGASAPS